MLPAIERRSGRSRYTSATRSSSRTATRCSPTSTETRSSRFASGRGARLGGSRRRRCEAGRSRSRRGAAGLRSVLGALVAVFAFGWAVSVLASAAVVFFDRPRPPRLPRRRLGLVVLDCPASSAGSVLTGLGVSDGAAASTGACSSDFRLDRNQRKKNLLHARALQQRRPERRRGACAAGRDGRWKTSPDRVPIEPVGPSVRPGS